MEGASYRVTVTLERGSDRPKCQRESKVHPTFEVSGFCFIPSLFLIGFIVPSGNSV